MTVGNLINDKFNVYPDIVNGTPLTGATNFISEARVGSAYHRLLFPLAVDCDLIKNQPLLTNPAGENLKTQYLAVGVESSAFDFA